MGPIPQEFQDDFGGKTFFTGWSSVYSIVSRYSCGPTLWTFDPNDMISPNNPPKSVTAKAYMNYDCNGPHLSDRAVEWAPQGSQGPFAPASKLWNILSKGVYGLFVPGTHTFAVIASTAGLESGIGSKIVQEGATEDCGGPCAYRPGDYDNYYWFFDVDDILKAEHVYDPRPYAYGVWDIPWDRNDDGLLHRILGCNDRSRQ